MHVPCDGVMITIEICEDCDEMGKKGCGYQMLVDGLDQPRPDPELTQAEIDELLDTTPEEIEELYQQAMNAIKRLPKQED